MRRLPRLLGAVTILAIFAASYLPIPAQAYAKANAVSNRVNALTAEGKEYALDQIIVRFDGTVDPKQIIEKNGDIGQQLVTNKKFIEKFPESGNFWVIQAGNTNRTQRTAATTTSIANTESVRVQKNEIRSLLEKYGNNWNVVDYQPSYINHTDAWSRAGGQDTPGEYSGGNHWYYDLEKLREMWFDQDCQGGGEKCGGSESVTVAVLDTGTALDSHNRPDSDFFFWDSTLDYEMAPELGLTWQIYQNEDETPNNEIDDDGNGYIDDTWGYYAEPDYWCWWRESYDTTPCTIDEWSEMGHPNDDLGHGTYVTGLISTITDNGAGSVSPAFNTTLMTVKVNWYDADYIPPQDEISGILYAMENGADVINMSFGGADGYEGDAVDYFLHIATDYYNIVPVAASGNDATPYVSYPAAYDVVMAVGASDPSGNRASYSNYGPQLDMVAAVGDGSPAGATYQQSYACFFLDYPDDCITAQTWSTFDVGAGYGTSFASPQVAAAAALIKARRPNYGYWETASLLKGTAIDLGSTGRDDSFGTGLLDFHAVWNSVWGDWSGLTGTSTKKPVMEEFNGRLYQAVKAASSSNIYIRSTATGTFADDWSAAPNGSTSDEPSLATFNGRLYMAVKGNSSGKIYTKSMSAAGAWDASWNESGGTSGGPIAMEVFDGKLYQAIKGQTSNNIYIRYTSDGTFDGGAGENWAVVDGTTSKGVALETFDPGSGDRLYLAVRGASSGEIYIRYTTDGVFSVGTPSENWSACNGNTSSAPALEAFGGRLFQVVKANSSNNMYYRYSVDGSTWSYWILLSGATSEGAGLATFSVGDDYIYMAVKGASSNALYMTSLITD